MLSVWIHTDTAKFSIASLTFAKKQAKGQRPDLNAAVRLSAAVPGGRG